jgi:3D (Asp-Asp-Asp) domain-containing protein
MSGTSLRGHRLRAALVAFTVVVAGAVAISAQVVSPVTASADSTGGLAACPFWAAGITPPPRPDTPFTPPLQTAGAVNFSARVAAPTLTGMFQNGQVSLTVSRVPGAVAYRIWRDGVAVAWVSDWGQPTLTAVDSAPCKDAYYTVVALVDNSTTDPSMGQLSVPYRLGADGVVTPGTGPVPPGTTITMMVTSYNDIGSTATGYAAGLGICAVDPRIIPWGTYFTVPDYGTCFAGDIGTWIQNDTVDVWLPGTQANNWGVQHRTITVIANPYGSGGGPTPSPSHSRTPTPSPSHTPSPAPSPTPSPSHSPTPTPTGSGGGTCAAAWNASTSYTIGQVVSYAGDNWKATYYSTGAVPGAPASWAVWSDQGHCAT